MSQGLPCINPICDYSFSLAEIRAAAALTCPRCGNVFQLGGTAAPAAPRLATPAAPSVPTPPRSVPASPRPPAAGAAPKLAKPVVYEESTTEAFTPTPAINEKPAAELTATVAFTAAPLAQRVETASEENGITESPTFALSEPPLATPVHSTFGGDVPLTAANLERRRQPGLKLWQQIVLGFALGGLLIGFPLMAFLYGIFSFQNNDSDDDGIAGFKIELLNKQGGNELACRLGVNREAWKQREDFKESLKAALALEQEYLDPKTQKEVLILLVVAGQDYGKQKPSDAELLKQAVSRLENCFGTDLVAETTPEETKLDGKRTLAMSFQGKLGTVDYLGKCYALTHHGFAYWVYVMQTIPIGVDQDLAEKFFEQMQGQKRMGFHIVDKRHGWTEQPPETDAYSNESGKMTIKAAKDRWESFNAKDADAQGEIFLRSKEKRKYQKKHEQEATVTVLKLNQKTADLKEAVAAAAKYVEQQKKELSDSFELKAIAATGKEKNLPKKVGNQMGQLAEFEMLSEDKEYKKYILLGVIHRPDHVYVVQCESFWQYRQSWRGEFFDMIATFKLGGGD